ncbi:hypothetical protein F2Q70_00026117 [Brassica cretica]|nr:hypothetical protein F2Q70_00026117 [Brassica cretica]KAF3554951.1 hypothetical protein F2Q69_00013747 [Brassica cretica]
MAKIKVNVWHFFSREVWTITMPRFDLFAFYREFLLLLKLPTLFILALAQAFVILGRFRFWRFMIYLSIGECCHQCFLKLFSFLGIVSLRLVSADFVDSCFITVVFEKVGLHILFHHDEAVITMEGIL